MRAVPTTAAERTLAERLSASFNTIQAQLGRINSFRGRVYGQEHAQKGDSVPAPLMSLDTAVSHFEELASQACELADQLDRIA